MTPTKLRECFEESEGSVDTETLFEALRYVRDDGR
jgi:hypothetical protein